MTTPTRPTTRPPPSKPRDPPQNVSARGRIRTCDLSFRKALLYPTELRGRQRQVLPAGHAAATLIDLHFGPPADLATSTVGGRKAKPSTEIEPSGGRRRSSRGLIGPGLRPPRQLSPGEHRYADTGLKPGHLTMNDRRASVLIRGRGASFGKPPGRVFIGPETVHGAPLS